MKKLLQLLVMIPVVLFAQDPKTLVHKFYVDDYAEIYTPEQRRDLGGVIKSFWDTVQIAIVTVNSLDGRDVADYATTLFNQWGVGTKANNGLLILIAPNEHKAFAATGKGIQGSLTDLMSAKLQRQLMVPEFKKGNHFLGTQKLLYAYIHVLSGDKEIGSYKQRDNDYGLFVFLFVFCVIVAVGSWYAIRKRRIKIREEEERRRIEWEALEEKAIADAKNRYNRNYSCSVPRREFLGGVSGGSYRSSASDDSPSYSSGSSSSSSSSDSSSSYSSDSSSSSSSFDSGSSFSGGSSDGGGGGSSW